MARCLSPARHSITPLLFLLIASIHQLLFRSSLCVDGHLILLQSAINNHLAAIAFIAAHPSKKIRTGNGVDWLTCDMVPSLINQRFNPTVSDSNYPDDRDRRAT